MPFAILQTDYNVSCPPIAQFQKISISPPWKVDGNSKMEFPEWWGRGCKPKTPSVGGGVDIFWNRILLRDGKPHNSLLPVPLFSKPNISGFMIHLIGRGGDSILTVPTIQCMYNTQKIRRTCISSSHIDFSRDESNTN